jgi:hypothetical protein
MDRRALLIGINSYRLPGRNLRGAVHDARELEKRLRLNEGGSSNYDCTTLLGDCDDSPVTRTAFRSACRKLFRDFTGDVLLYFSGHGVSVDGSAYLATHDTQQYDWGVPMDEIILQANASTAHDVTIILDCCHSGELGNNVLLNLRSDRLPIAMVRENLTILAATGPAETAYESGGHGLFTAAVCAALDGGASDHFGWVTAASVYGYVQRRFGAWDQRPVYKCYAKDVTPLRRCAPLIDPIKLTRLCEFFPREDHRFLLDPEYEPEDETGTVKEPVNRDKVAIAQLFKSFRDAGLLKATIDGEQLYWTSRRCHTVELTARGREYWWLERKKERKG